MKKEYIKPILNKGLSMESGLIMASIKGDGLQMEIKNEGAGSDADSRGGSFWDDSE